MASEQQQKQKEVEVEVEKDLVPKMASHYDNLSEKVKDSDVKDMKSEDAGKGDNGKKPGEESRQKQGKNRGLEKGKGGKEDVLDRAREKVTSAKEVAGKTLGSAKDAVAGITERTKELVISKTEEDGQGGRQEEEEEEKRYRDEGSGYAQEGRIGGILGAVGEALVEIAVSTKDLVFGKGKGNLCGVEDRNRDIVYDFGYGGRGEQEQHKDKH